MKNSSRKLFSVIIFVMFLACLSFGQTDYTLASPNKQIEVRVRTADRVQYDVLFKGTALLQNSTLSIDVDHHTLGVQPKVTAKKEATHDGVVEPVVHQKFARIRENYNELRLEMEGNYAVIFRAYDNGVAYRLETLLPQNEVKVYGEEAAFNFPENYNLFYPKEDSFFRTMNASFCHLSLRISQPLLLRRCPQSLRQRMG